MVKLPITYRLSLIADRGSSFVPCQLQIRDLWVELEGFRLRHINLDVAAGEYLVILGPTGTGKTVLLEAIAGLHRPSQGRILINGADVTGLPPEQRGIGFVYQDYALFPHLNAAENIAFGLRMRGAARRTVEERVAAIARLLGIEHLLRRMPETLSGGEAQRVALARALVVEPRLLLLDEPLSALDLETRQGLQRELKRIHWQLGTTAIHVTHDFEEAVALGDRVAVFKEEPAGEAGREGGIVQVGTPEEIFRRPASEFVARFVGGRNLFRGRVVRQAGETFVRLAEGLGIAAVTGLEGEVSLLIRPEDIVLSSTPLLSSARNCFRGRVVEVADGGAVLYVTVEVPPRFTALITRRSWEDLALEQGREVYLAFKASAVHLF
ncbi:MAG: ABC transporter ATP-binding protein [Anaerolineae bacterium]|nr:ABC transporter ATP-binding protein [Anaerolineae bacterium]